MGEGTDEHRHRAAVSTAERRLIPGEPGRDGYRERVPGDGESHAIRTELSGGGLAGAWQRSVRPLRVIDSAAPAAYAGDGSPAGLAALSRELSANDWQVRDQITAEGGAGAGTAADRNVVLALDWPRT